MSSTKPLPSSITFDAKPYAFTFPPKHTALLVIDMQRDFISPRGFGDIQGGNLSHVQASIAPTKQLLDVCRQTGITVVHTREGHKPDLSDCPSSKLIRQAAAPGNTQHVKIVGDQGKMGRLLVRGEYGHDIVDELQPISGETVIDKPGKGAFWATDLMHKLKAKSITHLVVCGVTTECCFSTTIREANDRGFECCGITQATAGYNPSFKGPTLDMISWSQGLFGFVASLQSFLEGLAPFVSQSSVRSSSSPQTPLAWDGTLDIQSLLAAYRAGLSPVSVIEALYEKIEKYQEKDTAVWILLESKENLLQAAKTLSQKHSDRNKLPPLYGIPFSIKDSFDVAGLPTTTACPPLIHVPSRSAPVYDKVIEQGAICIGKTNLDQLATGLTGCRSPHGIPRSVYNAMYVSGGSSSGSCVSVSAGLVSFSLATDTAGSGRVPAGFNGVVGFKPSRGLISARGITPACLSLDCVALIARNIQDARTVWQICEAYDEEDRYSRTAFPPERHVNSIGPQSNAFTFGIPPPEALRACSSVHQRLFNNAVQLLQNLGGVIRPIDWVPFEGAGRLLYDGTFVSERLASLPDGWVDRNRDQLHPVIREIFDNVAARNSTAVQAYRDLQAKALFTRQATSQFSSSSYSSNSTKKVDVIVVPTAPTHPTVAAVLDAPITLNSLLGTFTHFGNVLDLAAIAVPAGTYPAKDLVECQPVTDGSKQALDEGVDRRKDKSEEAVGRLPFSVTFLGAGGSDADVLRVAEIYERAAVTAM